MKASLLSVLVPLAASLVIPDEADFQSLSYQGQDVFQASAHWGEEQGESVSSYLNGLKDEAEAKKHDALDRFHEFLSGVEHKISETVEDATEEANDVYDSAVSVVNDEIIKEQESHRLAFLGLDQGSDEEASGHHHRHRHHHKPNQTVYELIAGSKYTTKLAKAINEYPDLVEGLNSTKFNFTVFAPTDAAFDKIPKHGHKPSKEFIKKILEYHVSPDFYPAGRVLTSRTIPSFLVSDELGDKHSPQRLSTQISFRGLTVNFLSRVIAVDIFGTNGVIHAVDSIIIPPPRALEIVELVPSEFSTLELGLAKTGLLPDYNKRKGGPGGTLFAPTNNAFSRLGPRVNAFLFSKYGQKYLKAILEYHVVPDTTLYSDALYEKDNTEHADGVPRGVFHVSLPTLLKGRELGIDIARYGRLIEIKINAFNRVETSDVMARDGVVHILGSVLLPPKKLADGTFEEWNGQDELEVDDLIERLEPYVDDETSSWRDLLDFDF